MMRLINSIENLNDRMIEDNSYKSKIKNDKGAIYTKEFNKKRNSMIQLIKNISEQYEIPLHFEKEEDIIISKQKDNENIIVPITEKLCNPSNEKKPIVISKESSSKEIKNRQKSIIIDLSTNKPINSNNIFSPMKKTKRKASEIGNNDNKIKKKKIDNKEGRITINKRMLERLKNQINPIKK